MNGLLLVLCACAVGGGLAVLALAMLPKAPSPPPDVSAASGSRLSRPCAAQRPAQRTPLRGRLPGRVALCVGTGIMLFAVTSWLVLIPIGFAGAWFLPGLLHSDGGASVKIARVDGIATFAEMMRDTLNAAAGLGQAITAAARSVPGPIAAEARELAAVIEDRTIPIDKALRAFGHKLADPTGDLVVIALSYAARNSARDLAPLLSDLADAARAEAAMRVRIGVAGAKTRTAVRVITAVVLGLGTLLYVFDEPFLAPYGTAVGQLGLLAISGLFAIGFAWLARLSRPTEQPRLLCADTEDDNELSVVDSAGRLPAPRRETAIAGSTAWSR